MHSLLSMLARRTCLGLSWGQDRRAWEERSRAASTSHSEPDAQAWARGRKGRSQSGLQSGILPRLGGLQTCGHWRSELDEQM